MILLLAVLLVIPLGLDLYMPVPEENPLTVKKIALGRRLFNDRRLSRDGSIACASCHDPERAFSDGRAVPVGVFGRVGRLETGHEGRLTTVGRNRQQRVRSLNDV